MTDRPTIGIPYAKPGVLSSDLEELLARLVEEMHDEGYGPGFEANWAQTILSELDIPDRYYVTCPVCDKRIGSGGGTEDEVTKGTASKYARHYAWQHTKARLGTVPSSLEVQNGS
jgi:hypothetical protein